MIQEKLVNEELKIKSQMNILCKGCTKKHKSDEQCAMDGTQRRCIVYKYNREKRKKLMGIKHVEQKYKSI